MGRTTALCMLLLCLAYPVTGREPSSPVPYLVLICDPVNSRHPSVHAVLHRDGAGLKQRLPKPAEIMHTVVTEARDYPAVLRAAAMRNQVVITAGAMPVPFLADIAAAFPTTLFVHIDGMVTAKNGISYYFKRSDAAFLTGLYAGLLCPGHKVCVHPWPESHETDLLQALQAGIQRAETVRRHALSLTRREEGAPAAEHAVLIHIALTAGPVPTWVADWPNERTVRLCTSPEKATQAKALQIWPDYRLAMERAIAVYLAGEPAPGCIGLDVKDGAWRVSRTAKELLPAPLEAVFQSELRRLAPGE